MNERKTNVEVFAQLSFQNTDLDIRVDATFKGEEQLFLCSFILCVQISSAKVWYCFLSVLIYFLLK